jgi:hypothetical protein
LAMKTGNGQRRDEGPIGRHDCLSAGVTVERSASLSV